MRWNDRRTYKNGARIKRANAEIRLRIADSGRSREVYECGFLF